MDRRRREGGCFPNQQQRLLLRAALLKGEEVVEAWENWIACTDIDRIDSESFRLLPLLYKNLKAQGVSHPLMGRFKGVKRYTWYKNQLLFRFGTELIKHFQQAGLPTIILKGAALVKKHYGDYGLRPMEDFDFLVPIGQRRAAIGLLTQSAWKPRTPGLEKLNEASLDTRHDCAFVDARLNHTDLHWHVLLWNLERNADDEFWSGAVSVKLSADVTTQAFNSADQLLHTIVHGLWSNEARQIRWVADAITVLNSSPEIDWDRLIAQAERARLTLITREGLNYLSQEMSAAIPGSVLQRLQRMQVSIGERLEHAVETLPLRQRGVFQAFWSYYSQFQRTSSDASWSRTPLGFAKYLRCRQGEISWKELARWGLSKAIQQTRDVTFRLGVPDQIAASE